MKKNTKKDQRFYVDKVCTLLEYLGAKYIDQTIESDDNMGFKQYHLDTKFGNLNIMVPTNANIYIYNLFTEFTDIDKFSDPILGLPSGVSKKNSTWNFNNHNIDILLYLITDQLKSVIKPEETINNITKEELVIIMTETPFIRGIELETYRKEFEEAAIIIFDRISGKRLTPVKSYH